MSRISGTVSSTGEILFRNLRGDPAVIVSHLAHVETDRGKAHASPSVGAPLPQRLAIATGRVVVDWVATVQKQMAEGAQARGYPGRPSSILANVFSVPGGCLHDYRQVLIDKYLKLAEQVNNITPMASKYIGRLPRLALLHAPNSPMGPEIRAMFLSLASRQGARLFNYGLKNPEDARNPYIDRFQVQIHSQRWPTDFRDNIDMVTQPADLGNDGEVSFPQLLTAYKWLLGAEPRESGDVHLMGIFSDPTIEVGVMC